MENQHRLIKTYRELTQPEIDLINECKVFEAKFHELHNKIFHHVQNQFSLANDPSNCREFNRLAGAQPKRWLALAKSHVEQGMMALVRSVAQPSPPMLEPVNEANSTTTEPA